MQRQPRRNKIDIQINDWTLKKERLLRYWQEECRLYNWLYIQNVESYQLFNKVLSLISIILSSITGTTLLNQSNDDSATNNRLLIGFGIVSLLAGMVSSVKEFMDFGAKINANINCARQNSCIVNDIDEQLNMERGDRINGREFMKTIKDRKNDLIQNGPMIPRSKWNKLQKQINSGQGINFFNKKLFQEYMDQTINVGDFDFHMPGDDDGSPDSPRARTAQLQTAAPSTVTYMRQTTMDTTAMNASASARPSSAFVPMTVTRMSSPPPMMCSRSVMSTDGRPLTPSGYVTAQDQYAPIQSTNTAASEDEYIAAMNNENLCAGTIRQMLEEPEHADSPQPISVRRLFRFRSRGKRTSHAHTGGDVNSPKSPNQETADGYVSDPELELGHSKSSQVNNAPTTSNNNLAKYDPLLQYQLTRL